MGGLHGEGNQVVKRQRRFFLLKLVATVIILGFLLLNVDLGYSWELLRGATMLPVVMAIGLLAASHLAVALIWRRLLSSVDITVSIERITSLYFASLFLNNFFLGSVGGDSYRVYVVYRETGEGRSVLAATLLERLTGITALLLLGMIAVLFRFGDLPDPFRWFLLIFTGGGAIAGLTLILATGIVERLVGPIARRTSPKTRERLQGVFNAMRRGGSPGTIASVLVVALAAQAVRIWTHWWCAQALGITIAPGDLFVVVPLIATVAALPISIGGLGVREWAGVLLLAPFGIAEPAAVSIEFLAFLVGVATSLVGGLIFLSGREVRPSEVESIGSAV